MQLTGIAGRLLLNKRGKVADTHFEASATSYFTCDLSKAINASNGILDEMGGFARSWANVLNL